MNLPFKVNEREKKFLLIGVIVVIAIMLFYGYSWYSEFKKRSEDLTDVKIVMLEKQLRRISEKEEFEKRLNDFKQELEKREKAVLQGDKPAIAAAALSNLLRDAASASGFNITMERTLNTNDMNYYVAVPVEVGFTTTTEKVKEFLFKIRSSPFQLNVSEIKIRVINVGNPKEIYSSLIVAGFIKRVTETAKEGEELNKEGDNDT